MGGVKPRAEVFREKDERDDNESDDRPDDQGEYKEYFVFVLMELKGF